MLKIDRIEQNVRLNSEYQYYNEKQRDYTLTILGENNAILKTNPGKTLNELGMNLGASPQEAEYINNLIVQRLELSVINNKTIEYCMDIEVDFKLVEHKHIINTFLKALEMHGYKSGKLDFKVAKGKNIAKSDWKGIKGYKRSRAIKLYSKYEEQELGHLEGDLIRIELVLNAKALEQNDVYCISDDGVAKEEIREFLGSMKSTISRVNQYSKPTLELIEKAVKSLL